MDGFRRMGWVGEMIWPFPTEPNEDEFTRDRPAAWRITSLYPPYPDCCSMADHIPVSALSRLESMKLLPIPERIAGT